MMCSREAIINAIRKQGRSEEEIGRILANIDALKRHGLIKTNGGGANVGLTVAGRRKLAELRATGEIPPR